MPYLTISILATAISSALYYFVSFDTVNVIGIPAMIIMLAIAFVIQWLIFIPSSILQTERFYDLTGSATYLILVLTASIISYTNNLLTIQKIIIALSIGAWALRLGSFLFIRVLRAGEDKRFEHVKTAPRLFFMFWTLQGVWITICLAPALVAILHNDVSNDLLIFSFGLIIFVFGFIYEAIADRQKSVFNSNPTNQGKFINQGLWYYSRHPNYFGEFMVWAGITIMAFQFLGGFAYLALVSPIFTFIQINFISGASILQKRGLEKWGDESDYILYMKNTPKYIPNFFK